jgi:hypothetical protein
VLRKAHIMGLTAFKEPLKLDPSFWLNSESEVREVVTQEWGIALERLPKACAWAPIEAPSARDCLLDHSRPKP